MVLAYGWDLATVNIFKRKLKKLSTKTRKKKQKRTANKKGIILKDQLIN